MSNISQTWWKEGIVYQIYPRSFKDTSGNGVGDLKGIISKLDYIKSLGVDIIWLCPIYQSPNDDNGYDISDYQTILPEFGTMADFDELLFQMHERGLKLVMDLVVNHTSDEHRWFQESRKSRENPYRDYYHWWPAEKGTPPKRFSYFDVDGNAWKYDETTDSYYLHYFSIKQPDLKWENPKVREEIHNMMHFWFKKGVDGFRMDVIPFISKDDTYPELPAKFDGNFIPFYANGPHLHDYLREINTKVLSQYDVMTVGEAPGVSREDAHLFVDDARKELNMFFHFDLMALDRDGDEVFWMREDQWKLTEFKKIFRDWDEIFKTKGWGSLYLSNHDFPRSVSRWGNDSPKHWRNSATLLQTFLLTMRGTPYFVFGDEIGMTNIRFENISDYRDINTINRYELLKQQGVDEATFIKNEKEASRDNARTPMQWNEGEQAGFTEALPWIQVNQNHKTGVSVAQQENDPSSALNYFRKIAQLRKTHLGLVYGDYHELLKDSESVYAYTRAWEDQKYLVLLNFSTTTTQVDLSADGLGTPQLLSSNTAAEAFQADGNFVLEPYQACVYKLSS
ncbi:MAG: alpha-glucosidase [Bacteroidota bacterium]